MYSGKVISMVFLALAIYVCDVRADSAEVTVVSSAPCSAAVLKRKGVSDPSQFKSKILIDPKKVILSPKKPTIPGCFHLKLKNATVTGLLKQVTVEFENRLSGNPDPSIPVLQCKKETSKCGCGEKGTCMYCDTCKNFKRLVKDGSINNKDIDMDHVPNSCDCNIPADTYNLDFEVCTPSEKEMGDNLPSEVINDVTDGKDFSLSTILYGYDFRYNSLGNDGSQAAKDAIKARKARGLIFCYVLSTNISV